MAPYRAVARLGLSVRGPGTPTEARGASPHAPLLALRATNVPRLAGGAWSAVPALHSAVCRRFSPALLSGAFLARGWRDIYDEIHWRLTGYSLENTARCIEIQLLRHTSITVITAIPVDSSDYNKFIRFWQHFTTKHMSSASSLNTISAISHTIIVLINETFAKTSRDLSRDIDESLGNLP